MPRTLAMQASKQAGDAWQLESPSLFQESSSDIGQCTLKYLEIRWNHSGVRTMPPVSTALKAIQCSYGLKLGFT